MRLRRRLVRLHFPDSQPSLEGIYAGRVAGHYRILNPKLVEAEDRTVSLDGEAFVPCGRVIFLQRM